MTKRRRSSRTRVKRETNWLLIGSLIGAGILIFGVLIVLALRDPEQSATALSLEDYCDENPDRCASQGSSEAPVTMVEVSDFGCSHCTDFHNQTAGPLTEQYVDTGQVRWIALPYALGTETIPAAASAMCAGDQERYFEYADALFAEPDLNVRLSPIGFRQAAEAIGLDLETFDNCVESGRYTRQVSENREAARDVGITGTPTFFFNGERVEGALPLSAFQQTIDSLINS